MKIVAAYLLAVIGGNAAPDAAAVNKILESVGSKVRPLACHSRHYDVPLAFSSSPAAAARWRCDDRGKL
jgi:hypothetical protein